MVKQEKAESEVLVRSVKRPKRERNRGYSDCMC